MYNRIGIIGGGQLGRMLGFAAKRMGFSVIVIDPTPKGPAAQVVDEQIIGDYSDQEATKKLAKLVDVITIEIEHINTDTLSNLEKEGVIIHPSPSTVAQIKNKFAQKEFLRNAHIPTSDFQEVKNKEEIIQAGKRFGYPLVLKAKFDAFDGRGNVVIKNKNGIAAALQKLSGRELYVEKYVPFVKELAIMVARSTGGEIALYPVVETIHRNNICHIVKAPAPIDAKLTNKVRLLAKRVMKWLKGAGVFGIEMFLTKDKKILINEIAPRVHNSGHYTIEASVTDQFEQHIRAITGLPLGKTDMMVSSAVMINVLGDRQGEVKPEGFEKALKIPGVSVHLYGKTETRPERKMGHITVIDETLEKAYKKAIKARKYVTV